jgi:lysophospholipase L1-like esterase
MTEIIARCSGIVTFQSGKVDSFGFTVDENGIMSEGGGEGLCSLLQQTGWFNAMLSKVGGDTVNPICTDDGDTITDFVGSISCMFAYDDGTTSISEAVFEVNNSREIVRQERSGDFPSYFIANWLNNYGKPWNNEQESGTVGGVPIHLFYPGPGDIDWYSGGTGLLNRTFVLAANKHRIKHDVVINSAKYKTPSSVVNGVGYTSNGLKLLILRNSNSTSAPPTGTWSVVGTSDLSFGIGGVINDVKFITPISAKAGDYVGIYLGAGLENKIHAVPDAESIILGSNGDFSSGGAAIGSRFIENGWSLEISVITDRAYLAVVGDSIVEGHNTASRWHSYLHGGFNMGGNALAEPGGVLAGSKGFIQHNHCLGGTTLNWALNVGVPAAKTSRPRAIWIASGVNDIYNGRSLSSMKSDVKAIRNSIDFDIDLIMSDILPWNGTDEQANMTREYNYWLREYSKDNFIRHVDCYNTFGVLRPSTGYFDDLNPIYDQGDNIHLSTLGVAKLAAVVGDAMSSN